MPDLRPNDVEHLREQFASLLASDELPANVGVHLRTDFSAKTEVFTITLPLKA